MAQSTPRNNRPFVLAAVAALTILASVFVVYSYAISDRMDRSAASSGSSTHRKAPNTLQDQGSSRQPSTTGTTSNVPPATRNERN